MIVVKPIEITDSNLTSTVAEPDASRGEVEWEALPAIKTTLQELAYFAFGGGFLWATESGVSSIHKYTEDFVYIESFDISSTLTDPTGITHADGNLFVVRTFNSTVYRFNEDGTYSGDSFSVSAQGINISAIAWDGNFLNVFPSSNTEKTVSKYTADGVYIGSWLIPIVEDTEVFGASSDGVYMYLNHKPILTYNVFSVLSLSDYSELSSFIKRGFFHGLAVLEGRLFSADNDIVHEYSTEGAEGGGYNVGEQVIKSSSNTVYEAAAFNNEDPEIGAAKDIPTWIEVGSTNKYAMFDYKISSQTVSTSPIETVITSVSAITAVAGFNIDGVSNINVTVNASGFGEVYNYDVDMNDNSAVVDAWSYYFEPIVKRDRFILLDLPPYQNVTITTTFTGGTELLVGALVHGPQVNLGIANYNTEIQLLDFSKQQRNAFGDFEIVKRGTADLVKFDVTIPKNKVGYVRNQFKQLAQVPAVWVGEGGGDSDPTSVFGYYENYVNNISSPTVTDSTITIQGLV